MGLRMVLRAESGTGMTRGEGGMAWGRREMWLLAAEGTRPRPYDCNNYGQIYFNNLRLSHSLSNTLI